MESYKYFIEIYAASKWSSLQEFQELWLVLGLCFAFRLVAHVSLNPFHF